MWKKPLAVATCAVALLAMLATGVTGATGAQGRAAATKPSKLADVVVQAAAEA
jgi:hypothetical protein